MFGFVAGMMWRNIIAIFILHLMESAILSQTIPDAASGGRGAAVSCQAGTVTSGSPATVTCYFGINVSETESNFIVEKNNLDGTDPGDVPHCGKLVKCDLSSLSDTLFLCGFLFLYCKHAMA